MVYWLQDNIEVIYGTDLQNYTGKHSVLGGGTVVSSLSCTMIVYFLSKFVCIVRSKDRNKSRNQSGIFADFQVVVLTTVTFHFEYYTGSTSQYGPRL